jgi:hypothetical protein
LAAAGALDFEPEFPMKTTIKLTDATLREGGMELAILDFKLQAVVADGLQNVAEAPSDPIRHLKCAGLMEPWLGVVESGVPDLGSNPEHLKRFGRNTTHR